MPICTECTRFTPYLYTVYQSEYNLRLEQCSNCKAFADLYVEHDSLTLLLDLILLKRGVYRHLLFNRGVPPNRASEGENVVESASYLVHNRTQQRWSLALRLGSALIFLDAFIRWSHLHPSKPGESISPWSRSAPDGFPRVVLGCVVETLAFHLTVILSYSVLRSVTNTLRRYLLGKDAVPSDIQREFSYPLIPLALFYSSLTKLFLLFLLTIWIPTSTKTSINHLPTRFSHLHHPNSNPLLENVFTHQVLRILEDDTVDRKWLIRNILGGMSAGFGLRVILDTHPISTTLIILIGWTAKTTVSSMIGGWVGGNETTSAAWLAYSIP